MLLLWQSDNKLWLSWDYYEKALFYSNVDIVTKNYTLPLKNWTCMEEKAPKNIYQVTKNHKNSSIHNKSQLSAINFQEKISATSQNHLNN